MVNTGHVLFSGEIYYYWPLNSVDKSLVKHRVSLHNLLRYLAVAIMYSRNIPMAEKRIVCFQSKKVKRCIFFLIFNNYFIYLKRYFEKCVTNDFFSIFWRTAALMFNIRICGILRQILEEESFLRAYHFTWYILLLVNN